MKPTIRWFPHTRQPLAIQAAPLAHTRASALRGELRELRRPDAPGQLLLRWLPSIAMTMTAVALVTSTI